MEVDEEDIPALETVRDLLDDIISAAGGGMEDLEGLEDEGGLEDEEGMDLGGEEDQAAMDLGAEEEPEDEEAQLAQGILRDLNLDVVPSRKTTDLVKEVMNRVTRRLVRESIRRRR